MLVLRHFNRYPVTCPGCHLLQFEVGHQLLHIVRQARQFLTGSSGLGGTTGSLVGYLVHIGRVTVDSPGDSALRFGSRSDLRVRVIDDAHRPGNTIQGRRDLLRFKHVVPPELSFNSHA